MKTCSTCGSRKQLAEFPSKGRRCNACAAEATRLWYESQTSERRKEIRKRRNAWHQEKLRTDATYRERHLITRRKNNKKRWANPEHREKEIDRIKKKHLTPAGRARLLLTSARMRDRECNLLLADVLPIIEDGTCFRTGFKFDLESHATHHRNPFSPSLDRIDGTKGYVKGNIQVVCSWYNIAKNEYTDAQMLTFCRAVVDAADKSGV